MNKNAVECVGFDINKAAWNSAVTGLHVCSSSIRVKWWCLPAGESVRASLGPECKEVKLLELLSTQSLQSALLMHYVASDHSLSHCLLLLKTPTTSKRLIFPVDGRGK